MAKAYLRANLVAGKEKSARDALRKISGIKSADFVTGSHDLVAEIEANSFEDISTHILSEVRQVQGISETDTDFVFGW